MPEEKTTQGINPPAGNPTEIKEAITPAEKYETTDIEAFKKVHPEVTGFFFDNGFIYVTSKKAE